MRNLQQAYAYIAESDPDVAAKVMLRIQAGVNQLEDFPMLGYVGRVQGTRELVIVNTPYVVIYRVKGNMVQILRVLHHSKRYPD